MTAPASDARPAASRGDDTARAFRIDAARPGRPDLQIQSAGGQWLSVHDAEDPRAEARVQVDQALNGGALPPIVALLGVGLGFIVEELETRRPDVRIVAVELAPGLLAACRAHTDWSTRDRKGRLVYAADPSQPLPSPAWPHGAIAEKPLAIVHPVLARHYPAQYAAALAAVKQFFYEQRANAEARRRLAGWYLRHTIANLPALDCAPDVSALDGILKGEPAVLIGAGPSLDRLLPELAATRDRAWFIALDTALKPLLWAGIVPDLVISVDPTTLNGRHLINLPTRDRPYLVAEMSIDPRAVNAFSDRVFACRIGRADPWPWLEPLGVDATRLKVWGSVLTASCDLLARMRAGVCLFAGMDLAYTHDQPYCRGTSFEDDWLKQQTRDRLPSVAAVWEKRISEIAVTDTDIDGRPVRTAPQMVAFRNWVRANASDAHGLRVVNVTGAGILHGPNIRQASVTDALKGLPAPKDRARRLRAAAVSRKKGDSARLRAAVATALAAGDTDDVWVQWHESIPDFAPDPVRDALALTGRRLTTRKPKDNSMGKLDTDWIDVPYDARNFAAKAPLAWKVEAQNVATYAYRVHGKTMTLSFKINRSALVGAPAREIYLRIPGNYLPNRSMANTVWMRSTTAHECGYATVHPGLDTVVILRATEEPFAADPAHFFLFGQLTFEVQ